MMKSPYYHPHSANAGSGSSRPNTSAFRSALASVPSCWLLRVYVGTSCRSGFLQPGGGQSQTVRDTSERLQLPRTTFRYGGILAGSCRVQPLRYSQRVEAQEAEPQVGRPKASARRPRQINSRQLSLNIRSAVTSHCTRLMRLYCAPIPFRPA